jgi:hypothetical protein
VKRLEVRRDPHNSEDPLVFLAPDGCSLLCGEAGRLLEVEVKDIMNGITMLGMLGNSEEEEAI